MLYWLFKGNELVIRLSDVEAFHIILSELCSFDRKPVCQIADARPLGISRSGSLDPTVRDMRTDA